MGGVVGLGLQDMVLKAGAIPPLVDLLRHGSSKCKESAAATLWKLSANPYYRVCIIGTPQYQAVARHICDNRSLSVEFCCYSLWTLCRCASVFQGDTETSKPVMTFITHPLPIPCDLLSRNQNGGCTKVQLLVLVFVLFAILHEADIFNREVTDVAAAAAAAHSTEVLMWNPAK